MGSFRKTEPCLGLRGGRKRPPLQAAPFSIRVLIRSGRNRAALAPTVRKESDGDKAQDHHRPGGGFGNGRLDADSESIEILKNRVGPSD